MDVVRCRRVLWAQLFKQRGLGDTMGLAIDGFETLSRTTTTRVNGEEFVSAAVVKGRQLPQPIPGPEVQFH